MPNGDPNYQVGKLTGALEQLEKSNKHEHDLLGESVDKLHESFGKKLDQLEDRLTVKLDTMCIVCAAKEVRIDSLEQWRDETKGQKQGLSLGAKIGLAVVTLANGIMILVDRVVSGGGGAG
jgi:hypothetical protein